MMHSLFIKLALATTLAGLLFAGASAQAQAENWPDKPVKFIVPFPPGGSIDPIARLLAAKLSDALKQQIIVDNRPGASGAIGTAIAARSPADGYTFLFVFDTHATNPELIPNLPFDTKKDLAPVMLIGTAPMTIVTRSDKPYKSFDDVVKAARDKPDTVSYAVTNGTLGHLAMTQLQQIAGIKLLTVPYKGAAPMLADLLGGQVDLAVLSPAAVTAHVQAGRLHAVTVMGEKRAVSLPDSRTTFEQGYPLSAQAWWAIFAPTGTPQPIMDKFHAELVKVMALPDVRERLTSSLGMDIVASTPEALGEWLQSEMPRWGKVIRDNQIKIE